MQHFAMITFLRRTHKHKYKQQLTNWLRTENVVIVPMKFTNCTVQSNIIYKKIAFS